MRRAAVMLALALSCARAEPAPVPAATGAVRPGAETVASATTTGARPAEKAVSAELELERLYHPQGGDLFKKKLPPRSGDWLERFPEPGQSFLRYQSESPLRPSGERSRLVLQPLGTFSPDAMELLGKLEGFMRDYFALAVERRDPLPLPKKGRRTRGDGAERWTQHYTKVLLEDVLRPRLPQNAIVYLGVTLEDLYPDPSWNFVFGQATLEERVGVYSLARFFPALLSDKKLGTDPEARRRGLARSAALLAHETGHSFGMHHCTEYECVMNGSNSLDELDRQFGELCPVCLRKLAWNIGFDPRARYEKLRAFYRKEGIEELAHFIDRRLAQLDHGPP